MKKKIAMGKYVAGLLLFGLNGVIAEQINLPSYMIVFLRTLIGSAFLIAVFLISRQRLNLKDIPKKQLLFLILSGVSMGMSWIVLYEAYQRTGVGIASIAYYCGPIIVMLLTPFIFRQKTTAKQIVCFAVVIVGIFMTNLSDISTNADTFGLICGLLSAVFHALMVIFTVKAPDITGNKNSMIQLTVSFLTVAIFTIFSQKIVLPDSIPQWGWIVFLGIVNTGIGCYLYFSSISGLSVQSVSIIGYLEPLSSVVFAVILLGEPITVLQFLGVAMILVGAIVSEISFKKKE